MSQTFNYRKQKVLENTSISLIVLTEFGCTRVELNPTITNSVPEANIPKSCTMLILVKFEKLLCFLFHPEQVSSGVMEYNIARVSTLGSLSSLMSNSYRTHSGEGSNLKVGIIKMFSQLRLGGRLLVMSK